MSDENRTAVIDWSRAALARPIGRRALLAAAAGGALAVVAGATGPRAFAQDAGDGMVTSVAANLRSGPGTTFGVIRVLPAGTQVRLTGANESGFRQVLTGGSTGWVSAELLVPGTAPAPAPASGRPPASTVFTGQMKVVEPVNFRSGPSTSSSVDLTLAAQQVVEVSDLYQNGFRACRVNGLLGWVIAGALVPVGTSQPNPQPNPGTPAPAGNGYVTADVNLRSSAAYGNNVIRVLVANTAVQVTGQASGDFKQITQGGTTGWVFGTYVALGNPPSTPAPTPPSSSTSKTTAASNLRASASTNAAVLLVIPAGATVTVTGSSSNGFLPVTYNGVSGWVFASLLGSGGGTGTPAGTKTFYTTAAVNLREQPSLSGRVLTVVPAGTAVKGTGVEPVAGWSGPYTYGGVTGYISSQYLKS